MNTEDIKTSRRTIQGVGGPLVTMVVPDSFNVNSYVDYDQYNGRGYPYNFTITADSPDKTCQLSYYAPVQYLDDHMNPFTDNAMNDWGSLMHHYVSPEEIMENWAQSTLFNCNNVRLVKQIDFSDNQKVQQEKGQKIYQSYLKQGYRTLNWFVHKGLIREYAYTYDGYHRRRSFAMVVEATDYTNRAPAPSSFVQTAQMGMPNFYGSIFPGLEFNQQKQEYTYVTSSCTSFTLYNLKIIDCLEVDYPGLYKKAFLPLVNNAVVFTDELRADFNKRQADLDSRLAKQREQKREVEKIQREMRASHAESQRRIAAIRANTMDEISRMQRDTYEKQQASNHRIMQGWSDVIQGNTRFTDRYGDEHVIRTYDRYAYKRGDTYVTSDTPLDMPYDFEELKLKKW